MAPEIFSSKGYNEKVDIFSLGILLYALYYFLYKKTFVNRINGSPPFKGKDLKTLIKKTAS